MNLKIQMIKYKIKRKINIKSFFKYTIELFDLRKNKYNKNIKTYQWFIMALVYFLIAIFIKSSIYDKLILLSEIRNELTIFIFKYYPLILIITACIQFLCIGLSQLFWTKFFLIFSKVLRYFFCICIVILMIPLDIIRNFAKKGKLDFMLKYFQEVLLSLLIGFIISYFIFCYILNLLTCFFSYVNITLCGEKTALYICTLIWLYLFNKFVDWILRFYFWVLYKISIKEIKYDKIKVYEQFKIFKTDILLIITLILKALVIDDKYNDLVDALFYSTTIFSLIQRSVAIRKQK